MNYTEGALECALNMVDNRTEKQKALEAAANSIAEVALLSAGGALGLGAMHLWGKSKARAGIVNWLKKHQENREKTKQAKIRAKIDAEERAVAGNAEQMLMKCPSATREKLFKEAIAEAKRVIHSLPAGFQKAISVNTARDSFDAELLDEFLSGKKSSVTIADYDIWEIAEYYGVAAREIGDGGELWSTKGGNVDVNKAWMETINAFFGIAEMLNKKGYDVEMDMPGDWDTGSFDLYLK